MRGKAIQEEGDGSPSAPVAESERQETTLELAMRKAREELEAQEAKGADVQDEAPQDEDQTGEDA